jgi:hypothetical protein
MSEWNLRLEDKKWQTESSRLTFLNMLSMPSKEKECLFRCLVIVSDLLEGGTCQVGLGWSG